MISIYSKKEILTMIFDQKIANIVAKYSKMPSTAIDEIISESSTHEAVQKEIILTCFFKTMINKCPDYCKEENDVDMKDFLSFIIKAIISEILENEQL